MAKRQRTAQATRKSTVAAGEKRPSRAPVERRLEGRLFFEHGLPAGGVTLRLYNVGFGSAAVLLGDTISNENGEYAVPYDVSGKAANLDVRVIDQAGNEIPLAGQKFTENVREEMTLVVPDRVRPLAPEYERLTADLRRELGDDGKLAGTREDAERRDLTLLHQATGWDARLIALAAAAAKLSDETSLPAEILYSLGRVGLPLDAQQLAYLSPEMVARALQRAQDSGLAKFARKQIVEAVKAFETFSHSRRLNDKAPGAPSSLQDLLSRAGRNDKEKLSAEEQQTFARVYFAHRGEDAELWHELERQGIPDPKISALRLQGQLASLTFNNAPLAERLQSDIEGDLAQLVDADLHQSAAWKVRLQDIAGADARKLDTLIPAAYQGATTADRLDAYAADLARKVRVSFPTQIVGRMVEKGELRLQGDDPKVQTSVSAFLKNAGQSGFEIGRVPVAAFVRDNNVTVDDATLRALKQLQRLYQVTPGDDALKTVAKEGFTAAQDIVAFPHDLFLERYGAKFATREEAELVHRKARQISAVTQNLLVMAKQIEIVPSVYAMAAPATDREAAKTHLIKHYPTLESLFGALDFCECEACRSLLSPAAYFVDLLQFLDPASAVWSSFLSQWKERHGQQTYLASWRGPTGQLQPDAKKTPLAALAERRPDLQHLPLTCENTNTLLPYIDLVNEILEYYVANGRLDEQAAHDTGAATTAELLAEPQNITASAYNALKNAQYPLTLPFDLWLETVRRFCQHFETPLWRVLESVRSTDAQRVQIFAEYLGLSPAEYAIFTESSLATWFALYGYRAEPDALTEANDPETGQRIDLRSAKTLSRRLGISYKELIDVVRTGFVNPQLQQLVVLRKLGVDANDVFRYKKAQRYEPLSAAETAAFDRRLQDLTEQFNPSRDPAGFNARRWLDAAWPDGFRRILVLADPSTGCDFDQTILRRADTAPADSFDFLRINLFVRLWRKLGWTMEETDRALQLFVPNTVPLTGANLGAAFKTALGHLAQLKALDTAVAIGRNSRITLLALWSDLSTAGKNPLYAQLFLTPSVLQNHPVFDDPLGHYLSTPGILLKDHVLDLRGALSLTSEEIAGILADAGKSVETAELSLATVSLLYRYGLLARALNLSVSDVITLKQLSGVDPFTLSEMPPVFAAEKEHPWGHTLRFARIADSIKRSALTIDALDYLLRHRVDRAGKYRPDSDATLVVLKTIAAGVRSIRTAHALPAAESVGEDRLRRELGVVFPADVVERFLAMLNGTVEFTASKDGVQAGGQLTQETFEDEPAIVEARYSPLRRRQTLTVKGVLFQAETERLKALFPSSELSALLDDVQQQARTFFDDRLQRQQLGLDGEAGFLDAVDFEALFAPLTRLLNGPAGDTRQQTNDKLTRNAQIQQENQTTLQIRRHRVAQAFLPLLQRRLIRLFIVEAITAQVGGDAALVETLLTDVRVLGQPVAAPEPLIAAFTATGESGLTTSFFDKSGAALATAVFADADTGLTDGHGHALRPAAADSARFEGFLEVPAAGAYRFSVALGIEDAEAELRFNDSSHPVLFSGAATKDADEIGNDPQHYIDLKPGLPYRFTLLLRKLNGGEARLLVTSETLPKGTLARLTLYPLIAIREAERALVRLSKALRLIEGLGLTEREVRHVATHAADFDNVNLSRLPTTATGTSAAERTATAELCAPVLRLLDYADLKRGPGDGTDALIDLFEQASQTYAETDSGKARTAHFETVARLIRRDEAAVRATFEALGLTLDVTPVDQQWRVDAPDLRQEKGVGRLWDALQIVDKLQMSPAAVRDAVAIVSTTATPAQRFDIARSVRNAVKARYDSEAWRRIAQSIFDPLRQRQRDALVAYVMDKEKLERLELLFESFLIDPGMEPVVQTSRLRLAISSVQLFIQRCLLNLEPHVHPSAVNSEQWLWMKRYRVWEANRRIFLFPENWLEPEFRDDKTPLFQALESTLLQVDVSNDLAEDALHDYLKQLEVIARLDIVTTYSEQTSDAASTILHVIGRTYNLPHQYFYRRYAHEMWTPWEPVNAQIEGDHVVAIVWRERLHLFWVTFLKNGKQNVAGAPTAAIGKPELEMILNWSECYQGVWTTLESTGLGRSKPVPVADDFDSRNVFVHAAKVDVDGVEGAVYINFTGLDFTVKVGLQPAFQVPRAFRVQSKNSQAELDRGAAPVYPPYVTLPSALQPTRHGGVNALRVTLDGEPPTSASPLKTILGSAPSFSLLTSSDRFPFGTSRVAALTKPFFFLDQQHTFFVEPALVETPIGRNEKFGVGRLSGKTLADDDWKDVPVKVEIPMLTQASPIDRIANFKIATGEDWLTDQATVLQFAGQAIGRTGGLDLAATSISEEIVNG